MLDTSAVIGLLELRDDRAALIQAIGADEGTDRPAVSVVTLGELAVGVQTAPAAPARNARQRSLDSVAGTRGGGSFTILPIEEGVWRAFGEISGVLTRKVGHNDKWIAATAFATRRTLITQDATLASAASAVPSLRVALVTRR